MVCPNCGKELSEQAKFCTGCGTTIKTAPVVTEVPPVPQKSGNKALLIVLIAVGSFLALCVIVAIIVIFVLFGVNRQKEPEVNELPEGVHGVIIGPNGEYEYEIIVGDGENPVPESNPFRDCYNSAGGYVLPDSGERYYSRAELERLSPMCLEIAFNEIFARRGYYGFQDSYIQEYFDAMPWYERTSVSFALNSYEDANAVLLDVMLQEQKGTLAYADNPYYAYRGSSSEYLLPGSDGRYLNADDLEGLNEQELALAWTEILARYGVIFSDRELLQYYSCKQWYAPSVPEAEFDVESVNEFEDSNLALIEIYEGIVAGDYEPAADNKYMPYYDAFGEMAMDESSTVELTYKDLAGRTPEELVLIRNEIFARYGYTFNHQGLMEYFTQCSWYRPSIAPGQTDLVHMTQLEYRNVDFIYKFEQDHASVLDKAMNYQVQTDYYTVTLPAYWRELAVVRESVSGGVHSLSFYEALTYDYGWSGGHLFTIMLIPEGESYDYPSYEYYGLVTDANGNSYHMIVRMPTDVQFDDRYKELYQYMSAEKDEIMATLTFQ